MWNGWITCQSEWRLFIWTQVFLFRYKLLLKKMNRPLVNTFSYVFLCFLCLKMNPKPRAWTGKQVSKHGCRMGRFHQNNDAQLEFGWSPIRTRRNSDAASEMSCNWWCGGLGSVDQLEVQFILHNFHYIISWKINISLILLVQLFLIIIHLSSSFNIDATKSVSGKYSQRYCVPKWIQFTCSSWITTKIFLKYLQMY